MSEIITRIRVLSDELENLTGGYHYFSGVSQGLYYFTFGTFSAGKALTAIELAVSYVRTNGYRPGDGLLFFLAGLDRL